MPDATSPTIHTWKVPALLVRMPECPLCDREVDGDTESMWCDTCGATWAYDHGTGEIESETDRCPSEIQPYRGETGALTTIAHLRYRCALPLDGHPDNGEHSGYRSDVDGLSLDDYRSWTDGQYPEPEPQLAEATA